MINDFSIKDWSEEDRPREKLLSKGKNNLSSSELLAILIGTGNKKENAVDLCKKVLASVNNNLNSLAQLDVNKLMTFNGIGAAKAVTIVAALELGQRRIDEESITQFSVSSSASVYRYMKSYFSGLSHEEFWVLYLNNSNKILDKIQLSKGGITGTIVDVRLVFKTAIQIDAVAVIVCHNHPSGSLKPSHSDNDITEKLVAAGKVMDVKLLDHLIVTENDYFSFADEGLL